MQRPEKVIWHGIKGVSAMRPDTQGGGKEGSQASQKKYLKVRLNWVLGACNALNIEKKLSLNMNLGPSPARSCFTADIEESTGLWLHMVSHCDMTLSSSKTY